MTTVFKYFSFVLCLTAIAGIISCDKDDDDPMEVDFAYHAHIHSPGTTTKALGETMHIEVEFESHTGMTVHHIQVKVYEKATGTVLYQKPDDPHVHASEGMYTFEDDFVLSTENGVTADTDYVFEASVWGHDEGVGTETETVEFHVAP